ncbi:hypothetical protein D3C76_1442280 [compost metagenome]
MDTLAAYFLKFSGSFSDHRTVMFGSGDGPMVYRVFRKRKLFLVTRVRPSTPIPAIDSVAQIGSPENSSSYSGVRRKRTIRSFMTRWSIIS